MNLEQFKTRAATLSSFSDKIFKADEMLFKNKIVVDIDMVVNSANKLIIIVSVENLTVSSKKMINHYFTKFLPFRLNTLDTDTGNSLVYSYDLSQLLV